MSPGRRAVRRVIRGFLLFVIARMPDPDRPKRTFKERLRALWSGGSEHAGIHWDRLRDKPKAIAYGFKNMRREMSRWVDDLKDDLVD